jgi:3'-5' exonuclease
LNEIYLMVKYANEYGLCDLVMRFVCSAVKFKTWVYELVPDIEEKGKF